MFRYKVLRTIPIDELTESDLPAIKEAIGARDMDELEEFKEKFPECKKLVQILVPKFTIRDFDTDKIKKWAREQGYRGENTSYLFLANWARSREVNFPGYKYFLKVTGYETNKKMWALLRTIESDEDYVKDESLGGKSKRRRKLTKSRAKYGGMKKSRKHRLR